ncbi:MAG TPA: ATP-binding protein [Saprospiraceae bacterium]|nr:ATP-binding protein [Saprospiraceae bacterium]
MDDTRSVKAPVKPGDAFYGLHGDDLTGIVYAMHEDRLGNLWLAGGGTVLKKWVLKNGKVVDASVFRMGLESDEFFDIYEDKAGRLWLITNTWFGSFDESTGAFHGKKFIQNSNLNDGLTGTPVIHQSADGTFWLGTSEGLKHYDPAKDTFTTYSNNPKDRSSLNNDYVKTICPDPQNPEQVLWLGTGGGGLNRFDIASKTFTHFTKADGLPDNVVYGILSDEEGFLWMSTNQGIARFDLVSYSFSVYTKEDGLQDNEFNSCAYFKSPTGELFFGGINGFNSFFSKDVKNSSFKPPVVLTDLLLANKKVKFGVPGSPLKHPISRTKELVLTYEDKIFSFEFAALDFTAPDRNQYAYKLENFDNDWQYIGNQHDATFTNIPPGTYIFRVKATNCDCVWNEEGVSLKIRILPPWWRSWWAYLAYALLLGSSVYWFYRFQLRRQLERNEAERLKEMDTLKTRLYTNITHEFRTPLTVIMGVNEQIETEMEQLEEPEVRKVLPPKFSLSNIKISSNLIRRNSQNLLRLINQMLDLSKLDSGMLKPDYIQADIIPYLQYLTESFSSMAKEKEIQLAFQAGMENLVMDFDEAKMQHIVYNLLSNALKFTEAGGEVVLHARQEIRDGQPVLQLTFSDTGAGIPAEKLPHIFDRFYQVDNTATRRGEGTGIGLTLTKELVELMQGQISVESEEGKGSVFTVVLPVRNISLSAAPTMKRAPAASTIAEENPADRPSGQTSEHPLLLIVEDNPDVSLYIRRLLENDYQVETAADGQAGLEKALELIPDIIISDVMMPRMDGFELTDTLKHDARTSHIPIILLTAKATEDDRIAGLKTGADAYLKKPFNKEELFIRLEKLIEVRRVLQARYARAAEPETPLPEPAAHTLDDLFLQQIRKVIDEKIDDPELGIADLCAAVHLGHTQLFRKLKALTGEHPTGFIRKVRLHKARTLLQTTQLQVSEIAYDLGFADPAYFSRAFSKEFGMPPSAVRP